MPATRDQAEAIEQAEQFPCRVKVRDLEAASRTLDRAHCPDLGLSVLDASSLVEAASRALSRARPAAAKGGPR